MSDNQNKKENEVTSGAQGFFMKVWRYLKLAKIELLVLAGILVLDQIVKIIVDKTMYVNQEIVVIPNFFSLTYVQNKGAAFGTMFGLEDLLGATGVRIMFIIVTTIAVALFAYFMYRYRGKNLIMRLGLALIISGALGNYFDRLFLGYVRDFAEIYYFGLDLGPLGTSFAIFNIADVALTVGVVMFAVYYIFLHKEPKKDDELVAVIGKPRGGQAEAPNKEETREVALPSESESKLDKEDGADREQ